MVFKIVKQQQAQPEHSEYYKSKMDIAAQYNTVFEPEDEDKRLDKLFLDPNLYHIATLRSMSRVMVQRKEQLVLEVFYEFFNKDSDIRVDSGIGFIGRTVTPLVEQDPRTGEVKSNPNGKFEFDIPFTPENVDTYLEKYPPAPNFEFRFYNGSKSTGKPLSPVEVKRKEFFQYATWDELFIGKEKRYTSSTLNKLGSLRKEVDYEEKQQFNKPPVDPLVKTKQDGVVLPLSEEVRKVDQVEINETKFAPKKETNNTGRKVVTSNSDKIEEDDDGEVTITTRNEKKTTVSK